MSWYQWIAWGARVAVGVGVVIAILAYLINGFSVKLQRVDTQLRVTREILELFEAALGDWYPGGARYGGPTDFDFEHPEFMHSKLGEDRQKTVTGLLNKLEKFATATLLLLRSPALHDLQNQIESQTSRGFLSIVNANFDVLCSHVALDRQIYPAVRRLYSLWDAPHAERMARHYGHMAFMKSEFRTFAHYRILVGYDYTRYADAVWWFTARHVEERAIARVTIQAIDKDSEGVPGWPVAVTVDGGVVVTRLEWSHKALDLRGLWSRFTDRVSRSQPVSTNTYVSSSSGTVVLLVRKTGGKGNVTIRADVPNWARPLIQNDNT